MRLFPLHLLLVLVCGCALRNHTHLTPASNIPSYVYTPAVEFWMLREGLCRIGFVQDDHIAMSSPIPCPVEELKGYLE